MADALVSVVLEKLASILYQEMQQQVRLVVGVEEEVQKLTSTLQAIRSALVDAQKRQITEQVVKNWLEKLKDISYDMDDVLDEWSTALLKLQIEGVQNARAPSKKVCSYIPSLCFCFNRVIQRHGIALKIEELNERLDVIASEKDKYSFKSITNVEAPERQKSTSFVDESEVCGRNQDKETIISRLLCETSQEEGDLYIISIVGMGGMGKTTLAQLTFNDDVVKAAHFEKRIWVCVSDPFDEIRIAEAIAKELGESDPSPLGWENLPQRIHDLIKGKKFLLVLDDVWTEDFKKWEPFQHCLKSGARGSRILVTTRNERVAKMIGTTYTHSLEKLPKEVCWSLFSRIAFFKRGMEDCKKLEEIGRKIADKCKGLPLAAKTLGSLMRFKKTQEDWQNVLDSEIWELEDAQKGLFPPLLLSYYDLPSPLKQCFSYCAVFPKDCEIKTDMLIELWMAQDYLGSGEMEITGREYFENLVMRSFFQDVEIYEDDGSIASCKMHDIVHDFAQFLTKNECFVMEVEGGEMGHLDLSFKKGRHSTIILVGRDPISISVSAGNKNMRTLLGCPIHFLPDLSLHLKCLRALDLSSLGLHRLPHSVGNLMHLRYLNLLLNRFCELPETVCDLCNLQTLDLTYCSELTKLPQGIGKLINLRHLKILNTDLECMPKGIGGLSSLRTLGKFFVSGGDEGEACKVGELKNLNNLKGSLCIRGLGNVADAGEAEKAELKSKKHLLHLELRFGSRGDAEKMNEVIEALQPHPNLQVLKLEDYIGTLFPNWMMSLTKLRKLEINGCRNCANLPPLGILPFLEWLEISGMDSLKKVGVEFLGIGIDDNDGTRSKDGGTQSSAKIAFPELKHLEFLDSGEWEEWDVMVTRKNEEEEEEKITIMPRLLSLSMCRCKKLNALPHFLLTMPLEELWIDECDILAQRYKRDIGEDWPKISHIPNIVISQICAADPPSNLFKI